MIKVETNEGRVDIEMEGGFIEILSETCAILNAIYGGMPEHLREDFARGIRRNTDRGGMCWMTKEQRREEAVKMLRELLAKVVGEDKGPEGPEGLGMRFEGEPVQGHPDPVGEPGEPGVPGEPVKADGDCSLEEMTRNAARMAMEKKEADL